MNLEEVKRKIETELKIQGKSPRTIKTYNFYNEKFLQFIKKDTEDIVEDDIKDFLSHLISDKNYNPSSTGLALSSLKFFYTSILKKKETTVDIKAPKRQRKLPDVLTRDEVKELIANAGSLRNKVLVETMYSSGLRVSECAKLKVNDLNLKEKTGLLKRGKGGKDRFFILSKQVVEDLKEYITSIDEDGYLFPGKNGPISTRAIQRVVGRIAARTDIKKRVYCHGLRHAFATHLLEDGVDIRLIQELLAHASLQTTQWYTSVSKDQLKKVKSPLDME